MKRRNFFAGVAALFVGGCLPLKPKAQETAWFLPDFSTDQLRVVTTERYREIYIIYGRDEHGRFKREIVDVDPDGVMRTRTMFAQLDNVEFGYRVLPHPAG